MSIEIDILKLENPSKEVVQHLASLLGEAFAPDPITAPILGGNRALAVPHMYANVKAGLIGGEVYVACMQGEGAEKALGCAVWYPPGKDFVDVKDLIPERKEVDSQLSPEAVIWKKDVFFPTYMAVTGRHLGTFDERRKLQYLHILGTSPASQRQGVARKLILNGIARADQKGWPVALETCTPQNVKFYESAGLDVLGQDTIPSAFGDITLTVMHRSPPSV